MGKYFRDIARARRSPNWIDLKDDLRKEAYVMNKTYVRRFHAQKYVK